MKNGSYMFDGIGKSEIAGARVIAFRGVKVFLLTTFISTLVAALIFAPFIVSPAEARGKGKVESRGIPARSGTARNLIVLVGDGMGVSQIFLGRLVSKGAAGKLAMETLPVTGLVTTWCLDELVTDSAAAATAMWTGHKTNKGMISTLPSGQKPGTIAEAAMKKGLSSGFVATTPITDATPGCLAAHVESRKDEDEVASQLVSSGMNVMLGGGRAFFISKDSPESARKDDRDLLAEAVKTGYSVIATKAELLKHCEKYPAPSKRNALKSSADRLLGLFASQDMLPSLPDQPSVSEMARTALAMLSEDRDGFFLMVEGSLIDIFCHKNDPVLTAQTVVEFDEAVGEMLEFAKKDGNTLVVVVADHETGGLNIVGGDPTGGKIKTKFCHEQHSASPIAVFAYGPGAELFAGVHENSELPLLFAKALGLKGFPEPAAGKSAEANASSLPAYPPLEIKSTDEKTETKPYK
jgi:alkaline phosphatase